ncbi:hypothetical protein K431DRAFT_282003 [Polychaeton citri CBS 116435]|uniref:Uncharacterized protein n=1 Tax=Polychaeton citri CBS 116435 TaxID=1314669 RepID=A0A9P4UTB9_9PEZI|nr:hypothetical protein K431DRAFT_282003 [Polychaeton citri CBS 116435]
MAERSMRRHNCTRRFVWTKRQMFGDFNRMTREILFDLGTRKDIENTVSGILGELRELGTDILMWKDVSEILGGYRMDLGETEATI